MNYQNQVNMRKEIKIRAQASKGRIIISGNGNYKIVKSVVFTSQQMEILNKASKEIDPKPLLKR